MEAPFRHYTFRHRIISIISRAIFDNVTYTVRHGLLRGMKRKGGLGWIPERFAGSPETPESAFWRKLDLRGLVVYDVGAWHGLLTMHFARQAKWVVAYEPIPENRKRLEENVALNGLPNVTVRGVALGAGLKDGVMRFDPFSSGTSSVALSGARGGDDERLVTVVPLDHDITACKLLAPDFVKVDVEGFELDVLEGARKTLTMYHPALFIELHGRTMTEKRKNSAGVVNLLGTLGYKSFYHIESGNHIAAANSEMAAQGHLYCTIGVTEALAAKPA